MTYKELSQLYYLKREIEMNRRRLRELEQMDIGVYAAEIADLRGIIAAKHQQCLYERSRLERYISGIDDSLTRQIFTYRFVEGMTWVQVAGRVKGGNSADGCRMMVQRYLRNK